MKGLNRQIVRAASTASASVDAYSDYVTLLLRGDGVSGTQTYTDSSANARVATTASGGTYVPTISSTQAKFGGTSFDFHTNNSYIGTVYSAIQYPVLTGATSPIVDCAKDFTVEGWAYFTAFPSQDAYFFTSDSPDGFTYNASMNGFRAGIRGSDQTVLWYMDNGTDIGGPTSGAGAVKFPSINTWHHWAFVKSGTTITTFINGTASSTTVTASTRDATGNFYSYARIGCDVQKQGCAVYLDDIRCTAGVARYSGNFTVDSSSQFPSPSDPYWTSVNTLLKFNNSATDNSQKQKTYSAANAVSLQYTSTNLKFVGKQALYIPTSYTANTVPTVQTTATTSDFQFTGGVFTLDFWFYPTRNSTQTSRSGTCYDYFSTMIDFRGSATAINHWALYFDHGRPALYWGGSGAGTKTQLDTTSSPDTQQPTTGNLHNSLTLNAWNHVAVCVYNGSAGSNTPTTLNGIKIFINGTQYTYNASSLPAAWNTLGAPPKVNIGSGYDSIVNASEAAGTNITNCMGIIDSVRFTNGVARYTGNFTPPTAPYPKE